MTDAMDGLDDDLVEGLGNVLGAEEFDYLNPPYVDLATFSASVAKLGFHALTGQLILSLRVEPDATDAALEVHKFPGQQFRITVERIDFPVDMVAGLAGGLVEVAGEADTSGEWASVNAK